MSEQNEVQQLRERVFALEAEKAIAAAGGEPALLLPLVREQLKANPHANVSEVVKQLAADATTSKAFRPTEKEAPTRDLSAMTDAEKTQYITSHGLDAYLRLVDAAARKTRAEMQRRHRGF